jgi:hypothetical protein
MCTSKGGAMLLKYYFGTRLLINNTTIVVNHLHSKMKSRLI